MDKAIIHLQKMQNAFEFLPTPTDTETIKDGNFLLITIFFECFLFFIIYFTLAPVFFFNFVEDGLKLI